MSERKFGKNRRITPLKSGRKGGVSPGWKITRKKRKIVRI